jgi:hypothetical protein
MTRLLLCTAAILALIVPANAQSVVPLRDRGRFHGYVGAKPHWCTWSAAKVCTAWRRAEESSSVRRAACP